MLLHVRGFWRTACKARVLAGARAGDAKFKRHFGVRPMRSNRAELVGGESPADSFGKPSTTESLLRLTRSYLNSCGLLDESAQETAARRVVTAVLEHVATGTPPSDGNASGLLLALARSWVEDFARSSLDDSPDWFWKARELLARFPHAFLETPLPALGARTDVHGFALLPKPEHRAMRQQRIDQPFAVIRRAIESTTERARDRSGGWVGQSS